MRFPVHVCVAMLVLSPVFLVGCGDGGGESTKGAQGGAALTPDELSAKVASLTGCSPFTKVDPYGDSVALAEYTCGSKTTEKNFLFVYDSKGKLQADLSEVPADTRPAANAVVVGDNWIYYTFSKSGLAAMLDFGGDLHRSMDSGYAVP